MPSTRASRSKKPPATTDKPNNMDNNGLVGARKKTSKKRKTTSTSDLNSGNPLDDELPNEESLTNQNATAKKDAPSTTQTGSNQVFQSRFPGLEFDTFEQDLDKWTITKLQEALLGQGSRRTKVNKEVQNLVEVMRIEFEKRMLMIALMAGVPEVVIWKLVGMGSKKVKGNPWIRFLAFCFQCLGDKMPDRNDKDGWVSRNQQNADKWHALSKDEQEIFKDPYFFALANLPDYSTASIGDDEGTGANNNENGVDINQLDGTTPAPTVHKLSDEDKAKYQPLFEKLVNIDKLHLCHGKPEPSATVSTLQKRSLVAVCKAHHEFSVVCQQNHISYYLTAASSGSVDGWSQTFSSNIKFANWALKTAKVPTKFQTYIHGQDVAKEIEAKVPQASDERKSRLTHQLNDMFGVHVHEKSFPKMPDPIAHIEKRGYPIKIVQKPGSRLSAADLLKGHRKLTDAVIQLWLKDIEDGLFVIEPKLIVDTNEEHPGQQSNSKPKKKKNQDSQKGSASKQPSKSRARLQKLAKGIHNNSEDDTSHSSTLEDEEEDEELQSNSSSDSNSNSNSNSEGEGEGDDAN
ncbi:uncharacterized protein MELLADRAFT_86738 [Melampsora larici-populina 98AG31]|uniref:Uncharacterized protein n=1 Tax=Melampsora larici-populina (strain 98AG31 / pathotype 3-4-7) TaxID=747676 RepID=F4R378_MELLP|nr:uncharacterized protein MELLADRAFT_86738 [Melampsora larici-populina 98AG31]EGG13215.1 hypothetical protein MELLADRAFT_86738 [Melampsora larici-populina 98AG31]